VKFYFPEIFDVEPTEELLAQYKCVEGKYLVIGLRVARKSWMRTRLAGEQNWKCCWCGCDTTPTTGKHNTATIEHVTPQAKGGTDDWENLASACSACNNNRQTTDAEIFMENKKLHSKEGIAERKRATKHRRIMSTAKKLNKNGWRRWSEKTESWHDLPFAKWIDSFDTISCDTKSKLIEMYGD